MTRTLIIIPAYNEEKTIPHVLDEVKQSFAPKDILVVDDASTDETYSIAKAAGVQVVHHDVNRGLGGALGTGLAAAKALNVDFAITLDADGQHDPSEAYRLLRPLQQEKSDVVIGSRLIESKRSMPPHRRLFNYAGNIITWIIFGVWTTDSQSGYRAFNKHAIKSISLKTNRMEVSSEFFKEIRGNGLRFMEVPITAIYTQYSLSKGQNFFEGIKMVARLILLRIRH